MASFPFAVPSQFRRAAQGIVRPGGGSLRLIGLLAWGIFAGCHDAEKTSSQPPEPAEIAVVKTWAELMNQPPVSEGTHDARLGIEAREAGYAGGVLLYCLTVGNPVANLRPEDGLGPFRVETQFESEKTLPAEAQSVAVAAERPDPRDGPMVFRRSIPLSRPGKYHVRVLHPNGAVVAQTTVTATAEPCHPWMPIALADSQELEEENDVAAWVVTNRENGRAIPRFDGLAPFPSDGQPPNSRLPTLIPGETGLAVEADGTELLVTSAEEIFVARPDWHFLVRWWVNGKPFVPEPLEAFGDANGVMSFGNSLLLKFHFVPERVGAKPGDKVELQLLYCRDGWEAVEDFQELLQAAGEGDHGAELLLSPRVFLDWQTGR